MPVYKVISKETGETVYIYKEETRIAWIGMEFVTHDHIDVTNDQPPPIVDWTKRHLTKLDFRKLFYPYEQEAMDEFEVTFEAMPFPTDIKRRIRTNLKKYREATYIDLDEPDTAMGLGVFAALGIIAPHRIEEIINGNKIL